MHHQKCPKQIIKLQTAFHIIDYQLNYGTHIHALNTQYTCTVLTCFIIATVYFTSLQMIIETRNCETS